ncbi:CAP domain-containing protein [Dactylosporangium sp. CS-033363]|uniref:CAP domain-containing protein n=1 Tax=Dactylosporangium sp. CS-033363 TaxID=3239935 RepID=UPI003D93873F
MDRFDRHDSYGADPGRHDDRGGHGDWGNQGNGDWAAQGSQGNGNGDWGNQGNAGQGNGDWGNQAGYQQGGYRDDRGYDGDQRGGYQEYGDYQGAPGPDELENRRGNRMLLAAGIGAVALVVVGAVAFGGSMLLSKSSNASPQSNAAPAVGTSTTAGDLLGDASGDPAASTGAAENAATSAAPAPTTKAPTTAAAPKTTQPTAKKTTAAPGGTSNSAYEAQVLAITNAERAKAGCAPLAFNAKLRAAAYKHSADMAANNYFSHDSQDGTSFATRISNEGYRWSGAAENIAKGQRTPEEVMNAWMNSSGHRANILNCKLKDLGVGLAYQGKTAIWTQDFGTQM